MRRWKWTMAIIGQVLVAASAMAAGPDRASWGAGTQIIDNRTYFDANSLLLFVTNAGSIGYDKTAFFGKNDGGYFPKGTNKSWLYAGGIWIGGKVGSSVRVAIAEYSNEFAPGPMKNGTYQADQGRFRVYKVNKGDTPENNLNLRDWPFEDGAPALKNSAGTDSLVNGQRIPLLQGDQTLWSVYNDADPTVHKNKAGSTLPLGVEIQSYVFGYARAGALGQTIFIRFTLINKGGNRLDSTYISAWADPDLGDATDDLVGCDTALSLGFIYNSGPDATYGEAPPSGGYDFFQGPVVPGGVNDSAWVSGKGVYIHGKKNLTMTSFNKYINGTDPRNNVQTYNYMKGLNPDGTPVVNPVTGQITQFSVSGDPVTGDGWIDESPADRRYMMSSGPFTMEPNDTQEVVIGVVVGQGTSPTNSIAELKRADAIAQATFDLNFRIPGPPPPPSIWAIPNDGGVQLIWGTEADNNVQYGYGPLDSTGTRPIIQIFNMEGFNLYQGASSSGPWTKLATYDLVDGIQRIYNDVDNPHGKERVVVQEGTDSDLRHDLYITNDRIRGGQLINDRPYYFTVTAYNYDSLNTSDFLIGPNSFGTITETFENLPGTKMAVVTPRSMTGVLVDTLKGTVGHFAGNSDGEVIVDYFDQNALTGHTYDVTFNQDLSWNLTDSTLDSVKLSDQQTVRAPHPVDGFWLRVAGLPPGLKDPGWEWSGPDSTRWFTSADFGGSFFGAGLFNGPDFFGSNIQINQYFTVELRFSNTDTQLGYRYLRGGSPNYGYVGYDPVPFTAWDVTSNPARQVNVAFVENAGEPTENARWMPGAGDDGGREYLFILRSDYKSTPDPYYTSRSVRTNADEFDVNFCWTPRMRSGHTEADLKNGQILTFIASKPNVPGNIFRFTAYKPGQVSGTVVGNTVARVHPVPNPYYNVSDLELDQFRRIIRFVNMPPARTIVRIFNLAGDLVRTLVKSDPASSELAWDVLTETGLPVASGLYIYHVQADGVGTKVGKMAVFTEVEQLNTY